MLDFTLDVPNHDQQILTFNVPGMFFIGEDRILLQEAAGICYAKLKNLVANESPVSEKLLITDNDIYLYRQLPAPRHRTAKHRPT